MRNEQAVIGSIGRKNGLKKDSGRVYPCRDKNGRKRLRAILPQNQSGFIIGDYLTAGYNSNFGVWEIANFVYLTATIDAAVWGAELAIRESNSRIYIVEPTGGIDDGPNLTFIRFPGNPTRSYRTREPMGY